MWLGQTQVAYGPKGKNMKYQKKPVVIDAYRTDVQERIETLEGVTFARPGDWIITGVKGERYPCRHEIFEMTYIPVEEERPCCPCCADVIEERRRQDVQWGGPDHDDKLLSYEWAELIDEQLSKANLRHDEPVELRLRMVKVASLAVAAIEAIDRRWRADA